MTFKKWSEKFITEQTIFGDIASDIDKDFNFPSTNDRKIVFNYLNKMNAAPQVIDVFDEFWKMYEQEIKATA